MSILSEKESIKFKNFMDLVKRNVPTSENIDSLNNIYQKLINKKNEMNNELNTSRMTPNEKITFEIYFTELHRMINLTEARINELNNPAGGRRRKMSRKRKSFRRRKSCRKRKSSRRKHY